MFCYRRLFGVEIYSLAEILVQIVELAGGIVRRVASLCSKPVWLLIVAARLAIYKHKVAAPYGKAATHAVVYGKIAHRLIAAPE